MPFIHNQFSFTVVVMKGNPKIKDIADFYMSIIAATILLVFVNIQWKNCRLPICLINDG